MNRLVKPVAIIGAVGAGFYFAKRYNGRKMTQLSNKDIVRMVPVEPGSSIYVVLPRPPMTADGKADWERYYRIRFGLEDVSPDDKLCEIDVRRNVHGAGPCEGERFGWD